MVYYRCREGKGKQTRPKLAHRPPSDTSEREADMNNKKMSKTASNMANKLYDEYGINYHDIEISVLNHLDFVQNKRMWSDNIGGHCVSLVTMGVGEDMVLYIDGGSAGIEPLPHDLWEPDFVDIDLYLKLKEEAVKLVLKEIDGGRYELTKVGGNKALISKVCVWTAVRQVWGRKNAEKWVELYDNAGRGYILPECSFKEAFKNK